MGVVDQMSSAPQPRTCRQHPHASRAYHLIAHNERALDILGLSHKTLALHDLHAPREWTVITYPYAPSIRTVYIRANPPARATLGALPPRLVLVPLAVDVAALVHEPQAIARVVERPDFDDGIPGEQVRLADQARREGQVPDGLAVAEAARDERLAVDALLREVHGVEERGLVGGGRVRGGEGGRGGRLRLRLRVRDARGDGFGLGVCGSGVLHGEEALQTVVLCGD
jgi:hypothetical protein